MIQGGDPTGTGTGSNGNTRLKAEFNTRPDRRHARGVLSMARSSDPDSASCQFFIMHADSPHLDGQYSAFGKATAGLEVVDKIANTPKGPNDRPKTPPKIVKITVNE
jgi:peptidyl-prolyl cis-trans isomerase B (cyclophilin B)